MLFKLAPFLCLSNIKCWKRSHFKSGWYGYGWIGGTQHRQKTFVTFIAWWRILYTWSQQFCYKLFWTKVNFQYISGIQDGVTKGAEVYALVTEAVLHSSLWQFEMWARWCQLDSFHATRVQTRHMKHTLSFVKGAFWPPHCAAGATNHDRQGKDGLVIVGTLWQRQHKICLSSVQCHPLQLLLLTNYLSIAFEHFSGSWLPSTMVVWY